MKDRQTGIKRQEWGQSHQFKCLVHLIVGINVDSNYRPKDFLHHQFALWILAFHQCGVNVVTNTVIILSTGNNFHVTVSFCILNVFFDVVEGLRSTNSKSDDSALMYLSTVIHLDVSLVSVFCISTEISWL